MNKAIYTIKFFLIFLNTQAQPANSDPCTTGIEETCRCWTSPVLCTLDELDGYHFTMSTYNNYTNGPHLTANSGFMCVDNNGNGVASVSDNPTWFRFPAWCEDLTLEVCYNNCVIGPRCNSFGIQAAVYSECFLNWHQNSQNPAPYTYSVACATAGAGCVNNSCRTLTMTGLELGKIYYFLADGCCRSACDVTINVIGVCGEPVIAEWDDPLLGDTLVCIGSGPREYTGYRPVGANNLIWFINGESIAVGVPRLTVNWDAYGPGEYDVCLDAFNDPCIPWTGDPDPICIKVIVFETEPEDPQRLFCDRSTIHLKKGDFILKEGLIHGSLLNGDILTLRRGSNIIQKIEWACLFQNPFYVTLTIRQIGGFETNCSIQIIPERIEDNIIIRELFYNNLDFSCTLPYRYFFTNREVEVDSISYVSNNILVEKVKNGSIIRVSPTGLPNIFIKIRFNVSDCFFRDSLEVKGDSSLVNPNIKIDLYEIKLAGDPSKYIARARGVASESLSRWGYVSKADYSSAYLSLFESLHYTFLDDLKDTSDYILFADISTSIDTSCFTRYFDAIHGSIFSYRSTFSDPDTSESVPSIIIFPNPGHGVINIKYTGLKTERARITLYTMQGVLVGSYAFTNHDTGDIFRIEDNNIAPGIYKLEFHDVDNNIFIPSKYIKQ